MRWIIAIVLSLGLATGMYFSTASWGQFKASQAELEFLTKEQKNYELLKKQYDELAQKASQANALWKDIQSVQLQPSMWTTHKLEISKAMGWEEFSHMMSIASNTLQPKGGYWFVPGHLRVVRVNGAGSKAKAKVKADAEQPGEVKEYEATLEGKFMIRKDQP